ncbi:MAG TPA: HAD family hydrolase [Kineosporiaceae bacterium]|jgi:HAD superfamily hydrolase (TIGR01549 family)|nr:HAD family hydrolase [Kineosporiaceae bacterium]
MPDTAIFDVDGTLVDTNYQHALAWYRAFRRFDITLPLWQLHRGIGMGGDNFVAHVAGDEVEEQYGSELRDAWSEEFDEMIGEVRPFAAARPLLAEIKSRGFKLVLASSGKTQHVEAFLDLVGGRDLADGWTTSDDVESSKPSPDLVSAALKKVGGTSGCMVGDSVWDVVAAGNLDVPTVGVLTGGFSREELTDAGAIRVFDSLGAMLDELDTTPFRSPQT